MSDMQPTAEQRKAADEAQHGRLVEMPVIQHTAADRVAADLADAAVRFFPAITFCPSIVIVFDLRVVLFYCEICRVSVILYLTCDSVLVLVRFCVGYLV